MANSYMQTFLEPWGGGAATAHRSQAVRCPCPISTCLGGVQAALPALQLLRHTRADNNDFSEKANWKAWVSVTKWEAPDFSTDHCLLWRAFLKLIHKREISLCLSNKYKGTSKKFMENEIQIKLILAPKLLNPCIVFSQHKFSITLSKTCH